MRWRENAESVAQKRRLGGHQSTGSELDRKYLIALVLYAVLAGLVWFTMDEGKVRVFGRLVEMRLVPLVVIGGMVLRTVLARHAEKIRRDADDGGNSTPIGRSGFEP